MWSYSVRILLNPSIRKLCLIDPVIYFNSTFTNKDTEILFMLSFSQSVETLFCFPVYEFYAGRF